MKKLSSIKNAQALAKKEQEAIKGGLVHCGCEGPNAVGCCYNGLWIPAGHRWYPKYCLA